MAHSTVGVRADVWLGATGSWLTTLAPLDAVVSADGVLSVPEALNRAAERGVLHRNGGPLAHATHDRILPALGGSAQPDECREAILGELARES